MGKRKEITVTDREMILAIINKIESLERRVNIIAEYLKLK